MEPFIAVYRKEHPLEVVPCAKTMYKYIHLELLKVRNIDLPMKTRIRPRKNHSHSRGQNKTKLGRSIETRCESVLSKEEFGHWELD
ncbi:hypothetical protein [Dolosicoccus paucivorans]